MLTSCATKSYEIQQPFGSSAFPTRGALKASHKPLSLVGIRLLTAKAKSDQVRYDEKAEFVYFCSLKS